MRYFGLMCPEEALLINLPCSRDESKRSNISYKEVPSQLAGSVDNETFKVYGHSMLFTSLQISTSPAA